MLGRGAGRAAERAGRAGRRWGAGAGGLALGRRAHEVRRGAGGDTAMQAATRPEQGPRYGHCACLGVLSWARFGVLCT